MGQYNKWDHLWMYDSGSAGQACAGPCDYAQWYAQNMDRIRTQYGQTTKQTSTANRRQIDTKPRKHRRKLARKQTDISWSRFLNWFTIMNYCICSATNCYFQSWYNKWDVQYVGRYNEWDHLWLDESGRAERGLCCFLRWRTIIRTEYGPNMDRMWTDNQANVDRK